MVKILYRTFFILLVAGLVSGALDIFVSSRPGSTLALINQIGVLEGRGNFNRAASRLIFDPGRSSGVAQQDNFLASFQREFRVGVGFWLALLDLAKNIAFIGLITVMVILTRRSFGAVKRISGRGRLGNPS